GRRRRPAAEAAPAPPLPPYELLRRELAAAAGLTEPAALHTALSLALRRYLHGALAIPAIERTTSEIAAALRATPMPAATRRALVALLRRSDEVRFARLAVAREEGERRLAAAAGLAGEVERELSARRAAAPAEEAA
ncbi:MAG TPA: hypothetical protein VMT16_14050, partial [Thermoanaerobaculia bacterium]|nr:hypothetical protein [Thermoanaerobaculia bacterium]